MWQSLHALASGVRHRLVLLLCTEQITSRCSTKGEVDCGQGVEARELGKPQLMLAGGAAGAVYWLTIYPADIVKSKMQLDSYQRPAFKGMADCARQVTSQLQEAP